MKKTKKRKTNSNRERGVISMGIMLFLGLTAIHFMCTFEVAQCHSLASNVNLLN